MNTATNRKKLNAFSEHVCGGYGCTTVIEKSGKLVGTSYQNTFMQMMLNPYLHDRNILHFILHIQNVDPENKHPLLTVWVPQGGQGKIVIDDTHIKFVDFHQLPPYGDSLITFIFDFASDEYYWLNDDCGSESEGYIRETKGTKEGEVIYGHSAQVNQQLFLKEFRKVVKN